MSDIIKVLLGLIFNRTLCPVTCYWLQERVMRNRHGDCVPVPLYMNAPAISHHRNVSVAITKVNIEVDRAVSYFGCFLNVIRCSVIILSIVLLVWYDPFICFWFRFGIGGIWRLLMVLTSEIGVLV